MKYILAADDELVNQMIIEEMLDEQFEVACVDDGPSCLDSIAMRLPELLLLDVSMPNMDGFEVCRRLRSSPQTTTLPVIMLSGHAHNEQIQEGLKAGANRYLTKPFSRDELLNAIAETLAEHSVPLS